MPNEMDDAQAEAGEARSDAKRAPSMRADFNDDFIRRLRLGRPPVGYDTKGKLKFEDDPSCKGYILWDTNQASPPGFGLRVGGKKTYIVRRKVDGRPIMPTVGNYADFESIAQAREKAAEMAREMIATGRKPRRLRTDYNHRRSLSNNIVADAGTARPANACAHHVVALKDEQAEGDLLQRDLPHGAAQSVVDRLAARGEAR